MSKKYTFKTIFQSAKNLKSEEVQRYLSNESSDEERFNIENEMLDNPLLSDAIEGYKNQGTTIPKFEFNDFLDKMNAKEQSVKTVQMPPRRSFFSQIAATAAILVLTGLGIYFWSNNEQQLYTQFHEPFESDFISLRDDSSFNNTELQYIQAMEAYEAAKYKKCIDIFEKQLLTTDTNIDALFYSGLAHLEIGNTDNGLEYLLQVRNHKKEYFREATWYAALAYLKIDNREKAKKLINDLLKEDGRYFEKAKKLNSKL